MKKAELLYKCNNKLGEGITFSKKDQNLFWLDIDNITKLYKFNLITEKKDYFEIPEIVTATSIKSKDELVLISNKGVNIFNIKNKKYSRILNIEDKIEHTRSNDGACDAMGRIWFGTMQNNFDEKGNDIPINDHIGKLYKVDNNKKITIVESGLGIPNTFIWSPDNTKFYFTDTLDGNILKYEYELQEGKISNKQNFAKFDRGFPDGSTIDTDGCIWNCRYGGSCVVRFDPNGNVDQVFEMPVKNITNCIFGGNDMRTLFITTASNNGNDQHELDGSVFALNLNYEGLEDHQSKIEIQ